MPGIICDTDSPVFCEAGAQKRCEDRQESLQSLRYSSRALHTLGAQYPIVSDDNQVHAKSQVPRDIRSLKSRPKVPNLSPFPAPLSKQAERLSGVDLDDISASVVVQTPG